MKNQLINDYEEENMIETKEKKSMINTLFIFIASAFAALNYKILVMLSTHLDLYWLSPLFIIVSIMILHAVKLGLQGKHRDSSYYLNLCMNTSFIVLIYLSIKLSLVYLEYDYLGNLLHIFLFFMHSDNVENYFIKTNYIFMSDNNGNQSDTSSTSSELPSDGTDSAYESDTPLGNGQNVAANGQNGTNRRNNTNVQNSIFRNLLTTFVGNHLNLLNPMAWATQQALLSAVWGDTSTGLIYLGSSTLDDTARISTVVGNNPDLLQAYFVRKRSSIIHDHASHRLSQQYAANLILQLTEQMRAIQQERGWV